jgi:uncharacterized lipoprotein YehR (DUF1307 family)
MTRKGDYLTTSLLVAASLGAYGVSEESKQISSAFNNTDLINLSIYKDPSASILDSGINVFHSDDILDEETHKKNVDKVLKKHAALFRNLKDR